MEEKVLMAIDKETLEEIMHGKICPYCMKRSELVTNQWGMKYVCTPCMASLTVPDGSSIAYGRLANAKLKQLQQEAQEAMVAMWTQGNIPKRKVYQSLMDKYNIPKEYSNVKCFSEKTCGDIIRWSSEFFKMAKGDG